MIPLQRSRSISRFHFCCLALLLVCGFSQSAVVADDRAAIKASVQDFYRRYTSEKDPQRFIAKCDLVTPGFKRAYAVYMKTGPDSDPVLQGQDSPASGYTPGTLSVAGDTATLVMQTHDKGFPALTVHLIRENGRWLINGVNGFKGR